MNMDAMNMKSKINMQMQMKKPIAPGPVVRAKSAYNNQHSHVPVQPPPRRNKFMRKKKKRPTPQAPPKPHRLNRSVSSVGSVKSKKALLPKKGMRLLQSSTSFEKGMHMTSQSEDSVVK